MHGVLGFGRIEVGRITVVDYFNGVADHLRTAFPGTKVLTTTVDPVGEVGVRAENAARQIAHPPSHMPLDPGKPLHIIAHSMGGLDARCLISRNMEGLKPRIRTLICLGTPHLGSPVASAINHLNPFDVLPFVKQDRTVLDELRSKVNAVHDLSESAADSFNSEHGDASTVHYFDVAGVGRNALFQTSTPFLVLSAFVAAAAGRNDGVVPFTSATRQRPPAAVWPADHADLIGHDLNGISPHARPAFDYLDAYSSLVRNNILLNQ